ncbi:ABC transporter permease [Actinokineospora iranica]|uniref:Putative ABC transport system permease protein n=1 Tax=Actinokineospora iranica TaxID=1271860 RepID=A0A1G6N433_9PSEU|nr:ABC transporter permease [Actinokineospora iranica]SDC62214.1 putative ABC transport system permease protein [Actinokineospora iranica]
MGLSGRFRSALIIGGQGVRARKLRTFLSMISLFLGVLAVVTVQAGAEIANRALLADIELTRGKDGTIQVGLPQHEQTVPIAVDTLRGQSDAVAAVSTQAVIGEPGVTPINEGGVPFEYAGQSVGRGQYYCDGRGACYSVESTEAPAPPGKAIELQIVGLTGDIRPFRPFYAEAGRWLDFSGEPSLSPGLVLNREAAKGFGQYRVPAEMRITGASVNSTPRILGVVHDGQSRPVAYVRADELDNWLPAANGNSGASSHLYLSPSATRLEQTLNGRLAAAGVPMEQSYRDVVNSKERIGGQLALMRLIFLGMAALVLLIGVAGILNVGLATVGERIEEFALRRAVGTPRLLLAGIVLAETLIIGLLTAAAAVGVGVAGLEAAELLFGSREPMLQGVQFPWQAGVAGVIAGLVAGVLGGLLPAIRAARIPIATVMRA